MVNSEQRKAPEPKGPGLLYTCLQVKCPFLRNEE
ncbi:hypothetical protein QE320_gp006 [Pseudomonas phage EM]|uniref:Uncharacterized protein n=1 Tax=Pseudomonas phage EM TaxID=2936914 RepID=A0AAE9KSI3_9CAUD|nr:hypothetical protein QE320_gp006 [Pseudomonas phage EM]UPW35808.1 hypothetical protein EM_006 [Pseudomonas phage EM]